MLLRHLATVGLIFTTATAFAAVGDLDELRDSGNKMNGGYKRMITVIILKYMLK